MSSFFNLKINSGYFNSFILFAQVVSLQINVVNIKFGWNAALNDNNAVTSSAITLPLISLYSIWSLELGRCLTSSVCVSRSIDTMLAITFQYLSAFYVFGLVAVAYALVELYTHNFRLIVYLWKPFRMCFGLIHREESAKVSVINAFATFLLLAYSKITIMSGLLITPTYLYNSSGHLISFALLYDGEVGYFGSRHLPYAILAIIIGIAFVILPPLFMLLYLFKCTQRVFANWPGMIAFMNAFQGCYKNGNGSSKDCRWFSAFYFMIRIIIIGMFLVSGLNSFFLFQMILQIVLIISVVIIVFVKPYKVPWCNNLDIIIFSYASIMIALETYTSSLIYVRRPSLGMQTVTFIAVGLPVVSVMAFAAYRLCSSRIRLCYRYIAMWFNIRQRSAGVSRLDDYYTSTARPEHDRSAVYCDSDPLLPDRMIQPDKYNNSTSYSSARSGVYGSF